MLGTLDASVSVYVPLTLVLSAGKCPPLGGLEGDPPYSPSWRVQDL